MSRNSPLETLDAEFGPFNAEVAFVEIDEKIVEILEENSYPIPKVHVRQLLADVEFTAARLGIHAGVDAEISMTQIGWKLTDLLRKPKIAKKDLAEILSHLRLRQTMLFPVVTAPLPNLEWPVADDNRQIELIPDLEAGQIIIVEPGAGSTIDLDGDVPNLEHDVVRVAPYMEISDDDDGPITEPDEDEIIEISDDDEDDGVSPVAPTYDPTGEYDLPETVCRCPFCRRN